MATEPGSAEPGTAGTSTAKTSTAKTGTAKAGTAKPRAQAGGETLLGLKRRARRINRALAEQYPYAHAELDFRSPFELVVATVLSAQTTDVLVNQITPLLFARYPDARSMAEAGVSVRRRRRPGGRPTRRR